MNPSIKHLIETIILLTQMIFTYSLPDGSTEEGKQNPPHLIICYADDMGWNDVSFHGSPQIPTPNIDALAASGIILNNYYGERICTPSRAALLTGKYSMRLGLQSGAIVSGQHISLPLEETTMAQRLKRRGYSTHMIGKWHLGSKSKQYLPTFRGFDSFFGYHHGYIDHFDYTHMSFQGLYGVDLYNGTSPVRNIRGEYATELFTRKAIEIINTHNIKKPLFLYLAHAAPHAGNQYKPLQPLPRHVEKLSYIQNQSRKLYAGTVAALDESVGRLIEALHAKDMLLNSVVLFASDNGGALAGKTVNYASNFPLRGSKSTLWEGGLRVPAVIWSPLFQLCEQKTSMDLMHVSDWLPTFYEASGGNVEDLGDIDGKSMWKSFMCGTPGPRTELLHNIDPEGMWALRVENFKLIFGPNLYDDWYGPNNTYDMKPQSMDSYVFGKDSTVKDIFETRGLWLLKEPDTWRVQAEVTCDNSSATPCYADQSPCLFDIWEDPCEYNNLASTHPEILRDMLEKLEDYRKTAVEPQNSSYDFRADPLCHDFTFVPWLDPEYETDCKSYNEI